MLVRFYMTKLTSSITFFKRVKSHSPEGAVQ